MLCSRPRSFNSFTSMASKVIINYLNKNCNGYKIIKVKKKKKKKKKKETYQLKI